ncbi:MAG: DUF4166 domain-containing protein [Burkholderiales bacterium]|nr:DUF4166 domain-containing protein [Burkholderiales bacterium]
MNGPSLFERALGDRFTALPPALRRFHRLAGRHELQGLVETDAPASFAGRLLARCLGTPTRATRGPIRFVLEAAPDAETWTRHFPDRTLRSRMRFAPGHVVERMGPARLAFALDARGGRLRMHLVGLRFLGIPCPAWLRPSIVAEETGDRVGAGERLHFRIEASVRGVGQVVGYRGHLVLPDACTGESASPRG